MFGQEKSDKKPNPVGMFFNWKSSKEGKTGIFTGRSKELTQEITVLPTEFILLSEVSTIRGRDNNSNSGIYSNEVVNVKKEEFVVKAFKGDKPLFEGFYDRDAISGIGGEFHKGLIVLEGDTLVEYYLKGGALFQWNEDVAKIDTNNYKVAFDKVVEKKKGAVIYYVPTWKQGTKITDEEREQALSMVDLLNDYRND